MSPTPGALLRRNGAAWSHEGSYILTVANQAALPVMPETDDVFAFTSDTRKLYVSKAQAWVEYSAGGSGATAGYYGGGFNTLNLGAASTNYELTPSTPVLKQGFTVVGSRIRCDIAGTYHISAAITETAATAWWLIVTIAHFRGSTTVASYPVVAGVPANNFSANAAVATFALQVNDTVAVIVSSNGTPTVDSRSQIAISSVGGPKGDQGPPGSLGTAQLDSLTDVTILPAPTDGETLLYNAAQAQWVNARPFPMVHQGRVTGALGSSTVGGVRDICVSTMPASFPYQVNVIGQAIAEWGFGSGNTSCSADVLALLNGSAVDSAAAQFCNAAYWARTPLSFAYTINAGGNPNCKLRISGLNFSGANCYFQGSLSWTAFRMAAT